LKENERTVKAVKNSGIRRSDDSMINYETIKKCHL